MSAETYAKLEELRMLIRQMKSVLVAYSGGVDSALVMAVAHEQLGERALACIGVSPSYPARERRAAIRLAEQRGFPYRILNPHEQSDGDYAANREDRCYFCRTALFRSLHTIAHAEGWNAIADGTHLDDVGDHVHGIRAAADGGVRSPLLELKLRKPDVRELACVIGLSVWDKPAMACLASRVPHGTPITSALLAQIEAAEDALAAEGLTQFRVRHHGELARIEVEQRDLPRVLENRQRIIAAIKAAGYRFVTLDLAGFHGAQRETDRSASVSIRIVRARNSPVPALGGPAL